MSRGRYYLSRIIKLGELNQEKLMNAVLNSPIIEIGKFDWTITDVIDGREYTTPFVFGKLSKYAKDGRVVVVDENTKSQINAIAPNLLEASSPFVYIPEFSGIAFLHVWNGIQEEVFPRRFKAIIEAAFDNFFVGCEVEPVSDYRAFVTKLQSIKNFTEISARIYPPNPLFGRLWKELNNYVKKRKVSDITLKETAEQKNGINTNIVNLITQIINNPNYQPDTDVDITDAAILMAADGYGRGKVKGYDGEAEVIVQTSDTQKSFLFSKEPKPYELVDVVRNSFKSVSKERDMGH